MNASKPDDCPFERHPIPPEILEAARAAFNEAEFLAEIEDMERNGGYSGEAILALLDEADGNDERAA
jgi:hypothetical protein